MGSMTFPTVLNVEKCIANCDAGGNKGLAAFLDAPVNQERSIPGFEGFYGPAGR
ncbi:MAG TPA: hypothetical protein VMR41_03950 [Patescibacteria group bacterium]|nr:hypothetical protein [Patescibacteria group bacterium]